MILFPWAIRNMVTLGEPQFLAPKNSNLPGELVPYGFMAWVKNLALPRPGLLPGSLEIE